MSRLGSTRCTLGLACGKVLFVRGLKGTSVSIVSDYQNGDKVIGHYGTVTEYRDGQWWMGKIPMSQDTVDWMLSTVLVCEAEPVVDNKISKSAKEQIPPAIYKWKLIRAQE